MCDRYSDNRKRIGIMGGTFDPIHIGHLILGERAYKQFELDEVWFMPSGNPPHKRDREGRASDEQRTEMVRLAIASNPHFVLCSREMYAEGYTYTYKTLEAIRYENPSYELFFIIGEDSLRDFDTWKKPERIAAICHLLVATRNKSDRAELKALMEKQSLKYGNRFLELDTPNLDISSHVLRDMIQDGSSVRYYITDPVLQYIEEQHMYMQKVSEGSDEN